MLSPPNTVLFDYIINRLFVFAKFSETAFLFFASGYDPHPPPNLVPVSPSGGMPPPLPGVCHLCHLRSLRFDNVTQPKALIFQGL